MSGLEGFGFVLPHWLYWGWLAVMPLIMMALHRRAVRRSGAIGESHPIMGFHSLPQAGE